MVERIKFKHDEHDFIAWLTKLRNDFGLGTNKKPKNNAPNDFASSLKINHTGVIGEMAGFIRLRPKKWNTFTRGSTHNLPDFEPFIDVKARPKLWHGMIVQYDDPKNWAYLLVHTENYPNHVDLFGWLWGHEVKQERFKKDPTGNRPAYFAERNDSRIKWRTLDELEYELRKRGGSFDP